MKGYRSEKERKHDELTKWQCSNIYQLNIDGLTIEELSRRYNKPESVIRKAIEKVRKNRLSCLQQAEAIKQDQAISAIAQCLKAHRVTGDSSQIEALAKVIAAAKYSDKGGYVTQVGVSVDASSYTQASQIVVKEVEGFYGDHGTRAHTDHRATLAETVTAHAESVRESRQIQGDVQRPPVGEDCDQYADDPAGTRDDTEPAPGGDTRGAPEVPVDGVDLQADPALYLEGSCTSYEADLPASERTR